MVIGVNSYQTVFSIVVAQISTGKGSSVFGEAQILLAASVVFKVSVVAEEQRSLETPPGQGSKTQMSNVVVAGIPAPQS